jgi:hypothetical protein
MPDEKGFTVSSKNISTTISDLQIFQSMDDKTQPIDAEYVLLFVNKLQL